MTDPLFLCAAPFNLVFPLFPVYVSGCHHSSAKKKKGGGEGEHFVLY